MRNPSCGIRPNSCGILVAESCAVAELDFILLQIALVWFKMVQVLRHSKSTEVYRWEGVQNQWGWNKGTFSHLMASRNCPVFQARQNPALEHWRCSHMQKSNSASHNETINRMWSVRAAVGGCDGLFHQTGSLQRAALQGVHLQTHRSSVGGHRS